MTSHDLFTAGRNGLIPDEVMDLIWEISRIPMPVAGRIGIAPDPDLDPFERARFWVHQSVDYNAQAAHLEIKDMAETARRSASAKLGWTKRRRK